MSAKSPSNALMQQWLVANASSSPSYLRVTTKETEDEGFAARLYTCCLYVFRYLCEQEAKIASTRTRSLALKEELGKLYLWGQAFGAGELDRALEQSDDLRETVLKLLGDIGQLVLRGENLAYRLEPCERSFPEGNKSRLKNNGSATVSSTAVGPAPADTACKLTLKVQRRTKFGCLTCRERRVKCSEERPICTRCVKSKVDCKGYQRRLHSKDPLRASHINQADTDVRDNQVLEQVEELKLLVEKTKLILSSSAYQALEDGLEVEEEDDAEASSLTNISSYDICEDIGFAISCLVELGPTLEQNVVYASNTQTHPTHQISVPFCASSPAKFYISLVREKFSKAHTQLVERLGEANWQRHIRIRRRMEGASESISLDELSVAHSVFQPISTFHDSGIGTTEQYAQSHTSFISSDPENDEGTVRVPQAPAEVALGKPLQCYICRKTLSRIKNRVDWKIHVFADLLPYICTFENCQDELAQFPSRTAWADHEFSRHRLRQWWACPDCTKQFSSSEEWERHLQQDHHCNFTTSKLQVALAMAHRAQERPTKDEECHICRIVPGNSRRAFVNHVCRHMEDIALKALPRNTDEDSEQNSISSNHSSYDPVNDEPRFPLKIRLPELGLPDSASSDSPPVKRAVDAEVEAFKPATNQDHATSLDREADDYVIKCVCGFDKDDRSTVLCERCRTWQHMQCYDYVNEDGSLLDSIHIRCLDHFCTDCQPRRLDVKSAVERKISRNEDLKTKTPFMELTGNYHSIEPEEVTKADITERPSPDSQERRFKQWWKQRTCRKPDMEFTISEKGGYQALEKDIEVYGKGVPIDSKPTNEQVQPALDVVNQPEGVVDPTGVAINEARRRGRLMPPGRCHSCNRAETGQWRRGPDGSNTLCNACGLHYAKLTQKAPQDPSSVSDLDDAQPAKFPLTRDHKDPTSASKIDTVNASIEPHDLDEDLIQSFPSLERQIINSRPSLSPDSSPDTLPPLERTPTPEHLGMLTEAGNIFLPDSKKSLGQKTPPLESQNLYVSHERSSDYLPAPSRSLPPDHSTRAQSSKRRRPKVQASQGDTVLLEFLGRLNHPDLWTKTGEECLPGSEDSDVDIDELSGD